MPVSPNATLADEIYYAKGTGKNPPSLTEMMSYTMLLDIADASADATYYCVCPHGGTVTKIYTVTDGAVLTADVTVTARIGSTAMTNGVVTIALSGAAAGDIDVATPTALNTVTEGQAVNFVVAGGGSAGTGPRIHLACVVTRT